MPLAGSEYSLVNVLIYYYKFSLYSFTKLSNSNVVGGGFLEPASSPHCFQIYENNEVFVAPIVVR